MSRVHWDTILFVYWFEDHPKYAARVKVIHDEMEKRGDILCTSTFTVGEVLTGPYKQDAVASVSQIRRSSGLRSWNYCHSRRRRQIITLESAASFAPPRRMPYIWRWLPMPE
jgi:hypothetical protein